MRNKIIVLVLAVFFISFLAAADIQYLPNQEQGEEVNLIQGCTNTTYGNLTRITYPNSSFALNEETVMTKNGGDYNYTFTDTETLGEYLIYGHCDENGVDVKWGYRLPVGKELTIETSMLYGFLFLLIGLFLFFSINGMRKSDSGAWLITYICITYVLIYGLVGIGYLLASDFLWSTPIVASILYIIWFIMGAGFLPFVIILSLYILGQEAKEIATQNYMKQGYSREDAGELSKKSKK